MSLTTLTGRRRPLIAVAMIGNRLVPLPWLLLAGLLVSCGGSDHLELGDLTVALRDDGTFIIEPSAGRCQPTSATGRS